MPAYDFRCTSCKHTFEVIRPASDTSLPECPECGEPTKRVFTPVGVVFKGSGFYNTDYKGKNAASTPSKPADTAPAPSCPSADTSGGGCANCPAAKASGE